MIIFPAVDIQRGKCVRLEQGRADKETVFYNDPYDAAMHWVDQGATWLHVIDLDGAFEGRPSNVQAINRICKGISIPVQVGGGIRTLEAAKEVFDAGVERVIIGTAALEDEAVFTEICQAFPKKAGVSLDTVDGKLKTKGWLEDSGKTLDDVLPRMAAAGAGFIIHTDISRDGLKGGVNTEVLTQLAQASTVPVIAAGGVSTLADIITLFPHSQTANLEGVITGRAIYDATLNLPEALAWIKNNKA